MKAFKLFGCLIISLAVLAFSYKANKKNDPNHQQKEAFILPVRATGAVAESSQPPSCAPFKACNERDVFQVNSSSVSEKSESIVPSKVNVEATPDMYIEFLDKKLEDSVEDISWREEINSSVHVVLNEWPGAKQTALKCSQSFCRMEFESGLPRNAERIMEAINNIPNIKGERIIQFDAKNEKAVAYFGRSGDVSLLNGF
jgi:hypothetical protein